jgi:hypothetical protein
MSVKLAALLTDSTLPVSAMMKVAMGRKARRH